MDDTQERLKQSILQAHTPMPQNEFQGRCLRYSIHIPLPGFQIFAAQHMRSLLRLVSWIVLIW